MGDRFAETVRTARTPCRLVLEAGDRSVLVACALAADHGGSGGPSQAGPDALTHAEQEAVAFHRRWYDGTHGPPGSSVPGSVRLRRLEREADSARPTVVELTGPQVLNSDEYAAAKSASPGAGLRARWRREQGEHVASSPVHTSEAGGA